MITVRLSSFNDNCYTITFNLVMSLFNFFQILKMNTTADDANHSKTVTKKVVVDREREVVESEPIDAGPVSLINLTEDFPPDSLEIHLINQRLTGIPDLAPYTMLRHLCFRQNLLTGLEGADLKEGLIELDLYDNRIVDVPQICLASLKSLDLSFNKIHHIKNLDGLPNLTDIYLLANKISKVTNLDNLVSLTNLELGSNNLRVIEGLDNLVNLKQLWVGKNKITHISGLGSLVNLEILSIQVYKLHHFRAIVSQKLRVWITAKISRRFIFRIIN